MNRKSIAGRYGKNASVKLKNVPDSDDTPLPGHHPDDNKNTNSYINNLN